MSFKSFLTTHRLDQFHDRMVEYGADSLEDWMQYTTEEFDEAAQQIKMAGGHTTRLRKALDEQRASSSPPEQQQDDDVARAAVRDDMASTSSRTGHVVRKLTLAPRQNTPKLTLAPRQNTLKLTLAPR